MLPDFTLRLAAGLTLCLLLLSPAATARPTAGRRPVASPGFFRTQLLVALGLAVGTLLWLWSTEPDVWWPVTACLGSAAVCALLGSVTWSLERSPGGVTLVCLTAACLAAALALRAPGARGLLGALSAAALLGSATSAMLLGHNYLVSPGMAMAPLYRLLAALAVALAARAAVDGFALWTSGRSLANLTGEPLLWLPVRWLVGLALPAVLCWMAWQTARIRSTQSATGILYVVVIFCFLGELTGQLLRPSGLTL